MRGLQERIDEQERRRGLAEAYGPVCAAAGFLTGDVSYQPEDLLLLAHRIWHDKVIAALSLKPNFRTYDPIFPSAFSTDYVAIVESLTDDERRELRSRIHFEPTPMRRTL